MSGVYVPYGRALGAVVLLVNPSAVFAVPPMTRRVLTKSGDDTVTFRYFPETMVAVAPVTPAASQAALTCVTTSNSVTGETNVVVMDLPLA